MEKLIYQWSWERIDKFLSQNFPYSRSFFHHIIARDWIRIENLNNKLVKKSYTLKNWDIILIDDLQRYLWSEILEEAPDISIPVIKETVDYLIIHKPKWVLSHPNSVRDANKASVVGFLYHRYKNLPSIWNFVRAGLIHRLDKDTDGLMILVKTEKWLAHFKKLFQAKSESDTIEEKEAVMLKKFYRAVCIVDTKGEIFIDQIKTELPHILEEKVEPKVTPTISKIWISKFITIWEIKDSLVSIELEILTWRTHQIRCHLSNHWLPILWDKLYGKKNELNEKNDMQLTAYRLIFEDLDWEIVDLKI